MDGDVHHYRVPLVSALRPQSPTDLDTSTHLGATGAIDRAARHFDSEGKWVEKATDEKQRTAQFIVCLYF